MGKEIERKYKLNYIPVGNLVRHKIKQGYLMFDGNKHLRVRIIDDCVGYITFKTIINEQEKNEFEYQIPLSDAIELYNSTDIKLEKERICTHDEYGNNVDIDLFTDGTQVVEIEFEELPPTLPDFCGEDVTGQKEYSNIYIAKKHQS